MSSPPEREEMGEDEEDVSEVEEGLKGIGC
jgi:hypothetical protein